MEVRSEKKAKSSNKGIASIEASVVVAFLTFISLFFFELCELKTVESIIYEAAGETAEYMAEYSYLMEHVGQLGVTDYPMAKLKFMSYVDDKALLEKYVTGGLLGITLMGSELPDEDNYVEIRYTYHVKMKIPLFCNFSKLCTGRVRQCAYFGKENGKTDSGKSDDTGNVVFLADGSEVYHKDKNCTYLKPSVKKTGLEEAKEKGYTKCRYCGAVTGDEVFITEYGEVYHSTMFCSRLKRNIREVYEADTHLPACSKCSH